MIHNDCIRPKSVNKCWNEFKSINIVAYSLNKTRSANEYWNESKSINIVEYSWNKTKSINIAEMLLRFKIRTEIQEFKTSGLTAGINTPVVSECLNEHVWEQLSQLAHN